MNIAKQIQDGKLTMDQFDTCRDASKVGIEQAKAFRKKMLRTATSIGVPLCEHPDYGQCNPYHILSDRR